MLNRLKTEFTGAVNLLLLDSAGCIGDIDSAIDQRGKTRTGSTAGYRNLNLWKSFLIFFRPCKGEIYQGIRTLIFNIRCRRFRSSVIGINGFILSACRQTDKGYDQQ